MSASPQQVDVRNKSQEEFEEEQQLEETEGAAEASDGSPVKRGRGRPKGSKNKKSGGTPATATTELGAKRKRGRPPKEKDEATDGEPPAKRKRGRPPKPKTEVADNTILEPPPHCAGDLSTKKKRGRPPKKT